MKEPNERANKRHAKQKYNNTYYLPQKQITSMKSHNTQ